MLQLHRDLALIRSVVAGEHARQRAWTEAVPHYHHLRERKVQKKWVLFRRAQWGRKTAPCFAATSHQAVALRAPQPATTAQHLSRPTMIVREVKFILCIVTHFLPFLLSAFCLVGSLWFCSKSQATARHCAPESPLNPLCSAVTLAPASNRPFLCLVVTAALFCLEATSELLSYKHPNNNVL